MNSNNDNSPLIIQCPECHTKFSVNEKAISDIDTPQFHCSRCDNIFSISKKDLKTTQFKIEGEKEEEPFTLLSNEDHSLKDEKKRTSAFLKKADLSISNKSMESINTASKTSPYHSFSIPQQTKFFEEDSKKDIEEQEELNLQYDTHQNTNEQFNNDDKEINSWLDDNANEFSDSLSQYQNNFGRDHLGDDNDNEEDLLAPPKKKHQWEDENFEPISDIPDDFQELNFSKRQIRSWNAMLRLIFFPVVFLIILAIGGFYSQYHKELFKKFDIGLFSSGNVPPAGLFLKNLKIQSTTLNNGENIKLITGKLVNDSALAINNVTLESFLFDDLNNVIVIKKTNANSQLGSYKLKDLTTLGTDIIENFQSSKMSKKKRLAPGEQLKFAIAFTNSDYFKKAKSYTVRIYSTS